MEIFSFVYPLTTLCCKWKYSASDPYSGQYPVSGNIRLNSLLVCAISGNMRLNSLLICAISGNIWPRYESIHSFPARERIDTYIHTYVRIRIQTPRYESMPSSIVPKGKPVLFSTHLCMHNSSIYAHNKHTGTKACFPY
jgi:hypothetical protein